MSRCIVGSRGSRLAQAQTRWVIEQLSRNDVAFSCELRIISTVGDLSQSHNTPLSSFGEKGIFAKELEEALLRGEIDFAVHSLKDMPHTLPPGLAIASIPAREDPRDVLIGGSLDTLPRGAVVGTGSVRRRALLLSRRPDLNLREIRGNVETRLAKKDAGEFDAICLAAAGLKRLGLAQDRIQLLDPDWFTPDPGQGALCLECRAEDESLIRVLKAIEDPLAAQCVAAERAFLLAIGGGCKSPIGARARREGEEIEIDAMLARPDGSRLWRASAHVASPDHAGRLVADLLKESSGAEGRALLEQ